MEVSRRIVDILVRRDGMTEREALQLIQTTRRRIYNAAAFGDTDSAEDIMMDMLGLEMDYITDLI